MFPTAMLNDFQQPLMRVSKKKENGGFQRRPTAASTSESESGSRTMMCALCVIVYVRRYLHAPKSSNDMFPVLKMRAQRAPCVWPGGLS